MSFLDNVARIRAELLGAPGDMPATQVVAAALPLMGILPEPSCSGSWDPPTVAAGCVNFSPCRLKKPPISARLC